MLSLLGLEARRKRDWKMREIEPTHHFWFREPPSLKQVKEERMENLPLRFLANKGKRES